MIDTLLTNKFKDATKDALFWQGEDKVTYGKCSLFCMFFKHALFSFIQLQLADSKTISMCDLGKANIRKQSISSNHISLPD